MEARGIRILVVVLAVTVLTAGLLCLFHDNDLHAGSGHLCLFAAPMLAALLPFASDRPTRLALSGALARSFVFPDLLAPPPRG